MRGFLAFCGTPEVGRPDDALLGIYDERTFDLSAAARLGDPVETRRTKRRCPDSAGCYTVPGAGQDEIRFHGGSLARIPDPAHFRQYERRYSPSETPRTVDEGAGGTPGYIETGL